jgi:FkbM family methyltransferase
MSLAVSLSMTDEDVIKSFPRYQGAAAPGIVVDFLGTRTRSCYVSELASYHNIVEGYPIPANFHATSLEWAGVLRAALDATAQLVAVELGAGWAPWLVALARAARTRGIEKIHLVGVEGSKERCGFMRTHFTDNGLDPDRHTLLHGVVGTADGVAGFDTLHARLHPCADFAAADLEGRKPSVFHRSLNVIRRLATARRGGTVNTATPPGVERAKCYSLQTLLRPFDRVDLIHVDIQGDEARVITSARQVLKEKVKRLVIGTHSRSIEQELLDELAPQSWVLESEEACQFVRHGQQMVLSRDGCQVWRNPTLDSRGRPSRV